MSSTRELLIKKIENDAEKNCYCENKGCLLNKEYKVGAMSLVDLIVELDEKLKEIDSQNGYRCWYNVESLCAEARAKLHKFLTG